MNEIELYRRADTAAAMDATGLPALIEQHCTDAIRDHYAPWTAAESSAPPPMAYRHWADLIRSTVYGPGHTKEMARHGDPLDYRTLNYLKAYAAKRMAEWVSMGRAIDPVKGYKHARAIAKEELAEQAVRFRVGVQILEADMLDTLPKLPSQAA